MGGTYHVGYDLALGLGVPAHEEAHVAVRVGLQRLDGAQQVGVVRVLCAREVICSDRQVQRECAFRCQHRPGHTLLDVAFFSARFFFFFFSGPCFELHSPQFNICTVETNLSA